MILCERDHERKLQSNPLALGSPFYVLDSHYFDYDVAGGAHRVGGARQEEPSRGEVVAPGTGEGEDWEGEQRVPRMREIVRWAPKTIRGVTGGDGDHVGDKGRRGRCCAWVLRNSTGGTASGAGEGRDSRAVGCEQCGDGMQASLAQRRMLVVARDVVGKVGGRWKEKQRKAVARGAVIFPDAERCLQAAEDTDWSVEAE
ncbi:hypothetical protein B0H16DRAFT_1840035 [Mycena metata]|uniref:Uncharacterized protein n=1 Tax=Mycena metata TaxID=1033252 RepID=A0AAD7IZF2_9AGAR|nr:hypothetical protein B0H16DRAFT_1840035 [Mycena metata]